MCVNPMIVSRTLVLEREDIRLSGHAKEDFDIA